MNEYLTSNEYIAFPFKDDSIYLSPSGSDSELVTDVVATHVFYNNSSWDGGVNDNAIAPDKFALLPGGVGSFVNVIGHTRGINGVMVDVSNTQAAPQPSDFTFKVGNDDDPSGWAPAPAPSSISVRPGEGVGGSDRIEIIWADGSIENTWLEVKLLASGGLGLVGDYAFYYGVLEGETGNVDDPLEVTETDEDDTAANVTPPFGADIYNRYDHNRDKRVSAADIIAARDNQGASLNAISPCVPFSGTPELLPRNFLIDAVITYYGGEQIYLKSLSRSGSNFEMAIGTADETLVVCELTALPEARDVIVFQNLVEGVTFKAVAGSGMATYLGALRQCGTYSFGTSLPFTDKAMDPKPYKVMTLGHGLDAFDGLVGLEEGYNFDLEYDESENRITVSVIPGGGSGRRNRCSELESEPIDYLASLNGKRAANESGAFILTSDDCWRVLSVPQIGIQLYNDCQPCCRCDDFVRVKDYYQAGFDDLGQKYAGKDEEGEYLPTSILGRAEAYNEDVEYFEAAVVPYMTSVRVYGSASKGTDDHSRGYYAVVITIHNLGVARTVEVTHELPDPVVVGVIGSWLNANNETISPAPTAKHDVKLGANRVAIYTFRLKAEDVILSPPITITTTADYIGGKTTHETTV